MKMIVLSDSHGRLENFDKLKKELLNCDYLIHLGDCEADAEYLRRLTHRGVCSVRGNNDFSCRVPDEQVLQVANHRILLTHGHRYHVQFSFDRLKLMAGEYDAVFYGHTHVPKVFYHESVLFLNPGSLCYNRDGSGISYARIELVDGLLCPEIEWL